jgi:hypothetical protein
MKPRALTDVAAAYELSEDEADRALRWAQIAKTAARGGRSISRLSLFSPSTKFDRDGKTWCNQCERRVSRDAVAACRSQWCKAKDGV